VDFRLRPFGRSGGLVHSLSGLNQYYSEGADLWEIQAALKLRPVAGNAGLGNSFIDMLRPLLTKERSRKEVADSIEKLRAKSRSGGERDVKNGRGGIRDIEFLIQGLQMIHASQHPGLLIGNTLDALAALNESDLLTDSMASQLRSDYIYLRKIEHYLQIWEDRQIHSLPADPAALESLAKRIPGSHINSSDFSEFVEVCRGRVYDTYRKFLLEPSG
jgi:glutamate-ammonia-ligase adenylyltransferase